jgi:predicted DsbA family dithiol-disulfide isomerase
VVHPPLFANRKALEPLVSHARASNLNLPSFETCLANEKYAAEVRADMAEGSRLGVNTTPTFILAVRDESGDTLKGMRLIKGAQSYERIKAEIDQRLTPQTPERGS